MTVVQQFLRDFREWASIEHEIEAVALVGSHARDTARVDSDVDLVILTSSSSYLNDPSWVLRFGSISDVRNEDYGAVQSIRVHYADGLEVEFGFAASSWADTEPIDAGTAEVVAGGMVILLDKHGALAAIQSGLSQASHQSH